MKVTNKDGKKVREATVTEDSILGFFGKYRFLSNFHMHEITMKDGFTYPSAENAYQAYKLKNQEKREPFTRYTCGEAQRMGQRVELREDWEKVKVDVMSQCLEEKFKDPELFHMLKETEPKHLEESNDWGDRFWGTVNNVGSNMLGKLLMQIRDRAES